MRFLLLVPVVALFLSNIPFEMEMTVPAETVMCSMDQQESMECSPEPVSPEENCCKKETTCICFYCFQILAPGHSIPKYRFSLGQEKHLDGFYLEQNWMNPFIDGPLQPPDVV